MGPSAPWAMGFVLSSPEWSHKARHGPPLQDLTSRVGAFLYTFLFPCLFSTLPHVFDFAGFSGLSFSPCLLDLREDSLFPTLTPTSQSALLTPL